MENREIFPAFAQNNVPVVVASSNMYAPYAGVLLRSLIDHASEEANYDIIILEREISNENKRLLKNLVYDRGASGLKRSNFSIRFYNPQPLFDGVHIVEKNKMGFPIETYYKILAPHILSHYKKIITIDADMLLQTDISKLLDVDLGKSCVGGVCDVITIGSCMYDNVGYRSNIIAKSYYHNLIGMENMHGYVNSGLLVFDCERYTNRLSMEKILNTAQEKNFLIVDQDALNYLLLKEIKLLDFSWNVVIPLSQRAEKVINAGARLYDGAYERSMENPWLLHWAGKPKPWVCPDVPFGSEWWQTALRTPFIGHIIARMLDEQTKRRAYYKKRYGKEDIEIWEPTPKEVDRS